MHPSTIASRVLYDIRPTDHRQGPKKVPSPAEKQSDGIAYNFRLPVFFHRPVAKRRADSLLRGELFARHQRFSVSALRMQCHALRVHARSGMEVCSTIKSFDT